MHIADPGSSQLLRQRIAIELWILPRAWNTANIYDTLDAVGPQKPEEVLPCALRMPNRQHNGLFSLFHNETLLVLARPSRLTALDVPRRSDAPSPILERALRRACGVIIPRRPRYPITRAGSERPITGNRRSDLHRKALSKPRGGLVQSDPGRDQSGSVRVPSAFPKLRTINHSGASVMRPPWPVVRGKIA